MINYCSFWNIVYNLICTFKDEGLIREWMALVMERDDILKRTIDKVSTLIYSHRISTNPTGQCVNAFFSM